MHHTAGMITTPRSRRPASRHNSRRSPLAMGFQELAEALVDLQSPDMPLTPGMRELADLAHVELDGVRAGGFEAEGHAATLAQLLAAVNHLAHDARVPATRARRALSSFTAQLATLAAELAPLVGAMAVAA